MFSITTTTSGPINTMCACVCVDDHSRVRLQPQDGESGSDYINANYVDVSNTHTVWFCSSFKGCPGWLCFHDDVSVGVDSVNKCVWWHDYEDIPALWGHMIGWPKRIDFHDPLLSTETRTKLSRDWVKPGLELIDVAFTCGSSEHLSVTGSYSRNFLS